MKYLSALLRHGTVVVTSFCLFFALSCQREEVANVSLIEKSNSEDPVLAYIVSLGFDRANIVDQGDFYLADGDIKFDKNPNKYSIANKGARPAHSIFSGRPIINYDDVDDITVRVANNFGTDAWRNRVIQGTARAVAKWNAINNSKISLTYTGGPNADITVMFRGNLGANYGIGNFPSNCQAGDSLNLANSTSGLDEDQLEYLITHELGHCLGFRHTNENSSIGYHVPDTPYSEAGSVMNSAGTTVGNTVPRSTVFSSGDLTAASVVYPSTAYADASDLNSSSNTINFKWTVSYFCNSTVNIVVFSGGTTVKSESAANSGQFTFSTIGLNPGTTYEFQVSDPTNPSRVLYTTTSI